MIFRNVKTYRTPMFVSTTERDRVCVMYAVKSNMNFFFKDKICDLGQLNDTVASWATVDPNPRPERGKWKVKSKRQLQKMRTKLGKWIVGIAGSDQSSDLTFLPSIISSLSSAAINIWHQVAITEVNYSSGCLITWVGERYTLWAGNCNPAHL